MIHEFFYAGDLYLNLSVLALFRCSCFSFANSFLSEPHSCELRVRFVKV